MKEEKIFFPSTGMDLEGLMSTHEAFGHKGGVVLCHPHPQHGGDMNNPVIAAAGEAASQEGLLTLRFNFRGVGMSGGTYGEGIGEQEDVKAAIDHLSSKQKDPNLPLFVLGYSFGAMVGLPVAAEDSRIKGMVAIAPPLELYDFGFMKNCKKRKLVIAGSQDLYCPTRLLEEWFQKLEEPKSLTVIQGADHFLFSHQRSLVQPLRQFFQSVRSIE
jgi:uncharacterized protein